MKIEGALQRLKKAVRIGYQTGGYSALPMTKVSEHRSTHLQHSDDDRGRSAKTEESRKDS